MSITVLDKKNTGKRQQELNHNRIEQNYERTEQNQEYLNSLVI